MRKFFTETFCALLAKDTESTLTNQEYETENGAKVADFGGFAVVVSQKQPLRMCSDFVWEIALTDGRKQAMLQALCYSLMTRLP
jgi:hypothetical protein